MQLISSITEGNIIRRLSGEMRKLSGKISGIAVKINGKTNDQYKVNMKIK